MSFLEYLLSSWQALASNKLRSFLTILGIVIGVGAVVFLVSFGRGQQQQMGLIFENMGANAIYVSASTRQVIGVRPEGTLTQEDAEALTNSSKAPAVAAVAPMYSKMIKTVYGNEIRTINVMGSTLPIQRILNYKIARGNFFTDDDIRHSGSVAILGDQAVKDLFGAANPIGETVRIGGRKFDVIGTCEPRGGFMGTNADSFIMVPLTTMQSHFGIQTIPQGHPVQTIVVEAASTDVINTAKDQITEILRQRHHIREGEESDFNVIDMQEILKRMNQSMAVFQVFLASVASISLLVGGIGAFFTLPHIVGAISPDIRQESLCHLRRDVARLPIVKRCGPAGFVRPPRSEFKNMRIEGFGFYQHASQQIFNFCFGPAFFTELFANIS